MSREGPVSPSWLLWYGLHIGLSMDETLDIPFGDLLTLIAIDQIKNGMAKEKREEDFWSLLKRK